MIICPGPSGLKLLKLFKAGGRASDRYGIMEKLKRLQDGEDLDDLLAEIDEELPSEEEDNNAEEENGGDDAGMTEVQRKVRLRRLIR